jgi:hypothetical protein
MMKGSSTAESAQVSASFSPCADLARSQTEPNDGGALLNHRRVPKPNRPRPLFEDDITHATRNRYKGC